MAGSGRLGTDDDRIVEALLTGASQREAATQAGKSERTVRRRLADPGFQRRLQEAQAEIVKRAQRKIVGSVFAAVDTLDAVVRNSDGAAGRKGAQVRVNAARALLAAFAAQQPSKVELDATITPADQEAALDKLRGMLEETRRNQDASEQAVAASATPNGHNGNGANGHG